jgi:hypothetical protein
MSFYLFEKNIYIFENKDKYKDIDKVNWIYMDKNKDKVNWIDMDKLSENPSAIHLLAPLNHEQKRIQNTEFFQELVQFVRHPTWQMKFASRLEMEFEEYLNLLMECNVF